MTDRLAIEIIEKIKIVTGAEKQIDVDTTLGDLEIQSLELTEIVIDLEDTYGIEIEMDTSEAWSNLKTVGDIVEATRALIASKN
ncbi:phosphopantetheine-binding nodulation protein NodF (plasmid) [Rhizobium etli]|uniref:Phosphopantetheine-binding nodulation protein NodF n=1 Tax=Rhizobium etli TaxID=29449 RepID=A0AAN1EN67_RHIET|nr:MULTISPECIES: phosphopantetheine-binding protein [Rhizobium]ARO32531.1 phosphopantetheine-binding nodulation protein NodF [Rhizobium sp. NXC14]ARQ13408.1 phosphopantetheine-binding nodulation protein NodF [Rhizobium etli]